MAMDSFWWWAIIEQRETGRNWNRKFQSNARKNFSIVGITEHWNRLLREVVESPSLEILTTFLDTYLCDLLQGTVLTRYWTEFLEVPSNPYNSVILWLPWSKHHITSDDEWGHRIIESLNGLCWKDHLVPLLALGRVVTHWIRLPGPYPT